MLKSTHLATTFIMEVDEKNLDVQYNIKQEDGYEIGLI